MKTFTPWPARFFQSTNCCSLSPSIFLTALQELNESCLDMFDFASIVRFYWYSRSGEMRVRRTFCNVAMLGQMLRRTLATRQVSESGGFVTAFLMFWSDVPLMVHQHCPCSWSAIKFESKSFSWFLVLHLKDHMRGRLCYFPTRWLWAVSLPTGSKWRRCAELHTKEMVSVMYTGVWITTLLFRGQKSESFCVNP